jgi:hypothetical protein
MPFSWLAVPRVARSRDSFEVGITEEVNYEAWVTLVCSLAAYYTAPRGRALNEVVGSSWR